MGENYSLKCVEIIPKSMSFEESKTKKVTIYYEMWKKSVISLRISGKLGIFPVYVSKITAKYCQIYIHELMKSIISDR